VGKTFRTLESDPVHSGYKIIAAISSFEILCTASRVSICELPKYFTAIHLRPYFFPPPRAFYKYIDIHRYLLEEPTTKLIVLNHSTQPPCTAQNFQFFNPCQFKCAVQSWIHLRRIINSVSVLCGNNWNWNPFILQGFKWK
jgi:hypothetical protein